jgi:uncharacterized protein YecT (DUF1311 family)
VHIRIFVIVLLAGALVALSNVTAKSHLEGRVTVSRDALPNQFLESEKRLQNTYNELSSKLEPEGQKKLGIAQSAWKRFKAAECDFDATSSAESPLHPMSYTECLTVMNAERTADLQYELQWHQYLDPSYSKNEG